MAINSGDTVRVHYKGTLDDGTLFDTNQESEPLEFVVGNGELIPGFERAVIGHEKGETVAAAIEPEDAYGPCQEGLSHTYDREAFGEEPMIGGIVPLETPDGDQLLGKIVAIDGKDVTLDFNHPLAGERLNFEITIEDHLPLSEY